MWLGRTLTLRPSALGPLVIPKSGGLRTVLRGSGLCTSIHRRATPAKQELFRVWTNNSGPVSTNHSRCRRGGPPLRTLDGLGFPTLNRRSLAGLSGVVTIGLNFIFKIVDNNSTTTRPYMPCDGLVGNRDQPAVCPAFRVH